MKLTEDYIQNWKEMLYGVFIWPLKCDTKSKVVLAYLITLSTFLPLCFLCLLGLEPENN